MRRWFVALVLAAAGLQAGEAREALESLDSCLARLGNESGGDAPAILERCPDLAPALSQSQWSPWLPHDWSRNSADNRLSATGLGELRTLLARTAALPASPHTAQVGEVTRVLARVMVADAQPGGWWSRLKHWLREVLTPRPQVQDDTWRRRLFGDLQVSQAVLRIIAWSALAGVVALALAVLMNELRVAGVLRTQQGGPGRARTVPSGPAAPAFPDLERAPASEQPRLLLELITRRLDERQLLPPSRALTLQELTRAALLPGEADRARLRELATTCERMRFSEEPPAAGTIAAALRQGRELLMELDGAGAQLQGAG
ncbi:MAG TPA: DUF4129 domain-containing protein [Steroidobacteraceae bacterium]|nr:DUF4129 domain-containing protein [Steroidobacteraceae bacterium]